MSRDKKEPEMSNARAATSPYKRRYVSKKRTAAYRAPARKYKKTTPRASYERKRAVAQRLQVTVPECSIHYIDSLFDPFNTSDGVCIPCDLFPLPSQKIKTIFRGVLNLGTTGYGWVGFTPCTANDQIAISVTSTTSVGGSATLLNAFTNIGTGVFSQLPYAVADFNAGTVQARVVACGLRVRYSGAEQTRQGLYVACEEQDMQELRTRSYNTIKDIPQAYTSRPSGDGSWDAMVNYSGPVFPGLLEFRGAGFSPDNYLPFGGLYPFVIAMQGAANDAIEFEIVQHIEYIGQKVQGKTVSHADPTAYGKVIEATKAVSALKPLTPPDEPSAFSKFIRSIADAAPKLIQFGLGVAQSIATKNPLPMIAGGAGLLSYDRPPAMLPQTQRQRAIMA